MNILFDYETLRIIWWLILGLLLIGFAVMDGFDLGVNLLLPWVARTEIERRVVINTIGPIWEGNQVWLILGAGAIFAAWPMLYAVAFSGFYFAMLLVLFGLILRPIAFKYRSKIKHKFWCSSWDLALFISGLLPTLLFGVALGNVLQGVPFYFDNMLRVFYTGTLLELLNPFALLCGFVSIAMLVMHGGVYLANKTDDIIQQRAKRIAGCAALMLLISFGLAGVLISTNIVGFKLITAINYDGPANPLNKQVGSGIGVWLNNYYLHPSWMVVPMVSFVSATATIISLRLNSFKIAWITSAISIVGVIATVGVSMFPFLLPSSTQPNMSLLVWDASSSKMTLFVMLIATGIFLPMILLYTGWVYRVLRGKITAMYVKENATDIY